MADAPTDRRSGTEPEEFDPFTAPAPIPPGDDDDRDTRAPNPIGVPDQVYTYNPETRKYEWQPFTASIPNLARPDPAVVGRTGYQPLPGTAGPTIEQPPRYYDGHENRLFASLTPDTIANIQSKLINAGLLDPESEKFFPGEWFGDAPNAMKQVLTYANATGVLWEDALSELELIGVGKLKDEERKKRAKDELERATALRVARATAQQPFIAPAYIPPDYAELSTNVRQYAEQQLGRDMEDWEVVALADQMAAQHRSGYDQHLSNSRRQHEVEQQARVQQAERGVRAQFGEEVGPPGEFAVGEGKPEVDPISRFKEEFRKRYKPELDVERREEEGEVNRQALLASITGIDRTIG